MSWTEPRPPTEGISSYDHVICETPLGKATIEWKSWKEFPSYDVTINGEWICCEYSLEEAKEAVVNYLFDKYQKLWDFLIVNILPTPKSPEV